MRLDAVISYSAHTTFDENRSELKIDKTNSVILAQERSGATMSAISITDRDSFASPVINLMVGYESARCGEQSNATNKIACLALAPRFNSGRIADVIRLQIRQPSNTVQCCCGFIPGYLKADLMIATIVIMFSLPYITVYFAIRRFVRLPPRICTSVPAGVSR